MTPTSTTTSSKMTTRRWRWIRKPDVQTNESMIAREKNRSCLREWLWTKDRQRDGEREWETEWDTKNSDRSIDRLIRGTWMRKNAVVGHRTACGYSTFFKLRMWKTRKKKTWIARTSFFSSSVFLYRAVASFRFPFAGSEGVCGMDWKFTATQRMWAIKKMCYERSSSVNHLLCSFVPSIDIHRLRFDIFFWLKFLLFITLSHHRLSICSRSSRLPRNLTKLWRNSA